jgi:hypothetical protein
MIDDQVRAAMVKWPNVPAVFGWLRLDRRGQWWLIDRGRPGFDEDLHGLGSPITSPPIIDFIGRNYDHDDQGRWFWQNGPQRVYVDLDLAPLILRVLGTGDDATLVTHTGYRVARIDAVGISQTGDVFVETDLGPAAIHDLDLAALSLSSDGDTAEDGADGQPAVWLTLMGQRHLVDPGYGECGTRFVRRPRPD